MREFPGKSILRPWVLAARRVKSGTLSLDDLAYGQPSFSQFGEDRVVEQLLAQQESGFYVDVGAYHPVKFSNTYLLYRRGWSGINLEPNPVALKEIARRRPRDLTLPLAISGTSGVVNFLAKGSFSGIDDQHHLWGSSGERLRVNAEPLVDVLDRYVPTGMQIDLLDVDCEGHDLVALKSSDWDRYRPRIVLAEVAGDLAAASFLRSVGYVLHSAMRLTSLWVDGTAEESHR